jgi:ABC-type transport system involved in multi-copper enzyme maturation permease subunit
MNRRRILAITQLTIREAIRSRFLLALAALILTVSVAIPLLITDHASPAERLSVILRYSLNAIMFMLTVGTLWASCITIAGDIADRRLQLVLAKPVHRYELWLGKWLGVVAINVTLLAFSGLLIAGIIYHLHGDIPTGAPGQSQVSPRLLTARVPLLPQFPPDIAREIDAALAQQLKEAPPECQHDAGELRRQLEKQAIQNGMVVQPGRSLILHYSTPPSPGHLLTSELLFTLQSSQPDQRFIPGVWNISNNAGEHFTIAFTNKTGLPSHVLIPPFTNSATRHLTITFTRTDTGHSSLLLLAPQGKPPELLVPVGGFGANLGRALLVCAFRLAFVAALGVTMGSLLSLPVSVFAAFAFLIMMNMSGFISSMAGTNMLLENHHGHAIQASALDHITLKFIKAMNVMTSPLESLDPLPLLAEARLVSWSMTAKALAVLGILYSALVAIPGILLFRRRELK